MVLVMRFPVFALFATAITLVGCVDRSTVADALEKRVKKYGTPGMAAVATNADRTVEVAAVGVRHLGQPDLIRPEDHFHVGSNAKAMTATMIATLVEEGRIRWDTTLMDVFPEWKTEIHPVYQPVTLIDLLLCRGGVPEFSNFSYLFTDDPVHRDDGSQHANEDRKDWDEMNSVSGTPTEQRYQFARQLLHRPPAVAPRTRFLYSNAGYGIAGAMVERVTGESWETLMRARLFEPLGIRATFDWPAADDEQQPWGHFAAKSGVQPHNPHDRFHLPACLAPGGGISMSVGDFAKFLRLHLQGLQGRDGLLRAKTIAFLHARPPGEDPNAIAFACGWGLVAYEGMPVSWAEGSAGTFASAAVVSPSRDLAAAVFSNAGIRRAGPGNTEIIKWALERFRRPDQVGAK